MPEIVCFKAGGALVPADEQARQVIARMKTGAGVKMRWDHFRNVRFHRKYFAMLNFAYDNWEMPDLKYKGLSVEKNFDEFRRNLTVLSGFYKPVYLINQNVRLIPKSISFANMEENEFINLYEATLTQILKHVLTNYTREDIENVILNLEAFG